MRKKPLTRDSVVAVDIIAAERAMEGLLIAESFSRSCRREPVGAWRIPMVM
jgi:hypothetical protein